MSGVPLLIMRKLKTIILLVTITALCVITAIMPSVSAESGFIYYHYTPFTIVANTHNFGGILLEVKFKDESIVSRISVERVKVSNEEYVFKIQQYYPDGRTGDPVYIGNNNNILGWEWAMINFTYVQGVDHPMMEMHVSFQFITVKGTELKYYQGGEDYTLMTSFIGEYVKPVETNATVPNSYFTTLYANAQGLFESSLNSINGKIEEATQPRLNEAYDEGSSYGYSQGYSQGLFDGSQDAGGFWEGTISLIRLCAEKLWDFLSFEIAPGIKMGYITLGVPLLVGTITLILRKLFGGKDE